MSATPGGGGGGPIQCPRIIKALISGAWRQTMTTPCASATATFKARMSHTFLRAVASPARLGELPKRRVTRHRQAPAHPAPVSRVVLTALSCMRDRQQAVDGCPPLPGHKLYFKYIIHFMLCQVKGRPPPSPPPPFRAVASFGPRYCTDLHTYPCPKPKNT